MSIRLTIPVQNEKGEGSATIDLAHTYEEVTEKFIPDEAPQSPADQREKLTFTDTQHKRVFIAIPQSGWWVTEL